MRILPALLLLAPLPALARDVPVSTTQELAAAVSGAQAGDVITLAPGTYASGDLSCSANGTADMPIVLRSATPRGAVLQFNGLEGFKVRGAHWHFLDLHITGTCAADPDCEHAFHVTGAADGFVLRGSRVEDFNAQLKVNATQVDGAWRTPNGGLVEFNDLGDTRPRATSSPVTKLNIDTGDDWVVRGNIIHDFHKNGGNNISYGAFMKSGGNRGLFERNLVACTRDVDTGGVRIGLSFGGGGTGAQFCAPAFDVNVPCNVEHSDGVMRNNIIVNCSDVGIYINRGARTRVHHNTLVGTSGIDFRFDTTSGDAVSNLLAGRIRARDGAVFTSTSNMEMVTDTSFAAWYADALRGDLRIQGDVTSLVGAAPSSMLVTDDYCARVRPAGMLTTGALEHALGDCATSVPPVGTAAPDAGTVIPMDAGITAMMDAAVTTPMDASVRDASAVDARVPDAAIVDAGWSTDASTTAPDASAEPLPGGDPDQGAETSCACALPSLQPPWALLVVLLLLRRRR